MGPGMAAVISDDTDLFVLLLYFIPTANMKKNVLMQSTSASDCCTYHEHISTMSNNLAANALSGCDTVSSCFGIGKPTYSNQSFEK